MEIHRRVIGRGRGAVVFRGVLAAAVFFLAGCSGKPSNFYMLSPLAPLPAGAAEKALGIGIGPVDLPDYLDRPQIVTRAGDHEVRISDFDRWASTLSEAIPKVTAENLSGLLSTDRVYTFPWRGTPPLDFRVEIEVVRFDGDVPGNVELLARWRLKSGDGKTLLGTYRFHTRKPIAGQGYPGLVSAMNLAVYDLSREIAISRFLPRGLTGVPCDRRRCCKIRSSIILGDP